MGLIQGIDAGTLLSAFRQGRADRYSDEEARLKIAGQRRALQRQDQVQSLIGQIIGGGQPTGVAGAYAPTQPKQSFGQAFGADTVGALENGQAPPPIAPSPAVTPPQAGPSAPSRQPYDPDLLRKLVVLDPDTGSKIATALKSMDETDLKMHQAKNDIMGAAAHFLSRYPPEQRQQMMAVVAPQLKQMGWTDQEIAGANLTDDGLKGYQGVAIDYDKMIDNELAQREFEAGKAVPVTGGGNVAIIKPDGSARWAVGGGGAPAGQADIPHVRTPQEAAQLPPGSHFYDPNGILRTVPGGASGNAGGGFPGAQ